MRGDSASRNDCTRNCSRRSDARSVRCCATRLPRHGLEPPVVEAPGLFRNLAPPRTGAGHQGLRSNEMLQATGADGILVAARRFYLHISSSEPAGRSPAPELLALGSNTVLGGEDHDSGL